MIYFGLSTLFKSDLKKLKKESIKLHSKVLELISDIDENSENPLNGIGRPEKLKYDFTGCYSRRINQEHRLIYRFTSPTHVDLISCYGHYDDK